jgi:hypothetical protein
MLTPTSFVAVIVLMVRVFKVLEVHWSKPVEPLPAYVVGSLGRSGRSSASS